VNWETTDEEQLLKQSAAEFFQEKMPLGELRYLRSTKDAKGYYKDKWRTMAELGWAGILVPEEFGGLAFGFRGLGQILEESGRTLAATPLQATVVAAGTLIQQIGSHAQRSELLPKLASGELTFAVAHEEGRHHSETQIAAQATAGKTTGSFVLNGRKSLVQDGSVADKLIVLAQTTPGAAPGQGLSWFLVDPKQSGVELKPFTLVDSRPGCEIVFNQVALSQDALLGELGQAGTSFHALLDRARIGLAAELLGSASEAFQLTLKYLKERKQFGVAIGSFQALQHRMAHMYGELTVSRAVVARSLAALDEHSPDTPRLASLAKAKVSEVFQLVAREAVQLHGGIGMTDEHNIGFFLKRARVSAELLGTPSFHRDRYASLLEF
jgi:alkylation response protein AidB-like acyl-CoA dehydrogenase